MVTNGLTLDDLRTLLNLKDMACNRDQHKQPILPEEISHQAKAPYAGTWFVTLPTDVKANLFRLQAAGFITICYEITEAGEEALAMEISKFFPNKAEK